MAAYARGHRCLMQLLIEALDDPAAAPCGTCSVCTGVLPAPGPSPQRATVRRAIAAMRKRPNVIDPRKLWPTGGPWKGRIRGMEPGRAIARGDDSGWTAVTHEVQDPDAPVSAVVTEALDKVLTTWRREGMPTIDAVVAMPNLEHPHRVRSIAQFAATLLDCPVHEVLAAAPLPGPPSQPSLRRVQELQQSLALVGPAPRGTVLLVDEATRTRWGMTVAGQLLVEAGTRAVVPFAAQYEG